MILDLPLRIAMPSPFPGMDPYLESPEIFPDFHDSFVTYLREALQAGLPARSFAMIGRRLWAEPAHDEFREPFVEIYTRGEEGKRLVASIEVLSLANKTAGERGRDLYRKKQKELLDSRVHLVEMDFLRGGEPVTAVPLDVARDACGAFDTTSRSAPSTTSTRSMSTRSAWRIVFRRSPSPSCRATRR
jgi:Protein of unknown function (DUF4058)